MSREPLGAAEERPVDITNDGTFDARVSATSPPGTRVLFAEGEDTVEVKARRTVTVPLRLELGECSEDLRSLDAAGWLEWQTDGQSVGTMEEQQALRVWFTRDVALACG